MDTKEIFPNRTRKKYFQIGHQGNVFKLNTQGMFSKWTARKYFQNGDQGNIFKLDTK